MSSPVHISKLNGKLEGFRAISTNTVSNPFCIKMNKAKKHTICSVCYSHNMLNTFRKNAQPALERNSQLLSSRRLAPDEIPFINQAYFRFQAHGELINQTHLANLVAIAERNPNCNFALWSKRKGIVSRFFASRSVPSNLILVYSNPDIDKPLSAPPKPFHKTFNNVSAEWDGTANCTGQKCKDCLACYEHNGVSQIVEHVK